MLLTYSKRAQASCHHSSAARRGPPSKAAWVVGVAGDAVMHVEAQGGHSQLMHVGFAQQDGSGLHCCHHWVILLCLVPAPNRPLNCYTL